MKKKKITLVNYKVPLKELLQQTNEILPIKLSNSTLIDEIHQRYPIVMKSDISLIIKSFFEVLRESLLSGEIVNFNKTFSNMHLKVYNYRRAGKKYISIKVKISTPVGIK